MSEGNRDARSPVDPWRKASFRPDIEGLRAIAILLVVAFHVGISGLRGGFIGVDVFFVLSGYLITGLLVREMSRTGRLSIVNFYARRIRRLLPAAVVMLFFTLVAVSILLSPDERQFYSRTALAAGVYASNIWFQINSSDYFARTAADNPFLHTWTLAVEEQFYLLWPMLLVLAFRISRSKRVLATAILAVSAVSFVACLWLLAKPQSAFFSSPARAWEFGVGGLAALIPSTTVARLGRPGRLAGILGLLTIGAGALLINSDMPFPSATALLPVLGTTAVLLSGAESDSGASRFLRARPLQYIGRLSYSWYLWHWPVLILGAIIVPSLALPGRAFLALLALGIAAVSYSLVEAPIRFSRYSMARPLATLGLAALITLATTGASWIAKGLALEAANTPKQHAIEAARIGVSPALAATGCFLDFTSTREPECAFGKADSPTTIVLFGDSHAAQWFSAFDAISNERQWRLVVLTKMGCPTPSVDILLWTMKRQRYTECSIWRETALKRILELKPALVILSDSDNHVTDPSNAASPRLSLQQWQEATHKTLKRLDDAGINTVILRDTPGPGIDVPTCLSRADVRHLPAERCAVARRLAIREDVFRVSKEAAIGLLHVSTMDLTDHFCSSEVCPPVIGGTIVYGQPGHIALAFGRTLAGSIAQQIAPTVTQQSGRLRVTMTRGGPIVFLQGCHQERRRPARCRTQRLEICTSAAAV